LICLANLAAKSHVVSVRVQHDKIPHPILLVSWFHFHDGAVLLYLVKIIIDLITEDKGRTPSDRSLSAKPWSAASLAKPWEQGSIVT